jgi:hypothetical protein
MSPFRSLVGCDCGKSDAAKVMAADFFGDFTLGLRAGVVQRGMAGMSREGREAGEGGTTVGEVSVSQKRRAGSVQVAGAFAKQLAT